MNRTLQYLFSLAAMISILSASGPAHAGLDANAERQAKLSFSAKDTSVITATVEALNYETREASLRGPEGNIVSFIVSDNVKRLAQISVGDTVTVEIDELFTVDVYENDGALPGAAEIGVLTRNAQDEAPGAAAADSLVIVATVQAIDFASSTATLLLPNGSLRTVEARDPDNLRKASVGDLVVMTVTQSVAISVAPPAGD